MLRLGLINAESSEMEAFLAWGALTRDTIVQERARALPRDGKYPTVIPGENYRKAIEQMTPTERKELLERVHARLGKK